MDFKLHTTDLSPFGQRVKISLRVKGLLGQTELIDTFGGTDLLAELAPMRQIPVLEHDGKALPESQVIVEYIEDIAPNPALLPEAALQDASVKLLARLVDLYIAPHVLTLIIGMNAPAKPADMTRAFRHIDRGLSFLENYLHKEEPYAVGDALSLADLALAPFLFYVPLLADWHEADAFPKAPHCKAYLTAIARDPFIAKAFAEMETAYKARVDRLKSQENQ